MANPFGDVILVSRMQGIDVLIVMRGRCLGLAPGTLYHEMFHPSFSSLCETKFE